MNKDEVKYLLQNKRYIEAEIKDLEYQIEELNSLESISVGGVSYEERVQSSNKFSSVTERQALDTVTKIQKLQEEKIGLETQIKMLEQGMETLNYLEKKVLTLKYIENNKWEYINIKFKNKSCKHIAKKAIEKLSTIMK